MRSDRDNSSQNLNGLILAQSALVGLAVGLYDSGLWLPGGADAGYYVNGMTYSMGALALQVVATYFFKMFFEEGMVEKARVADMQRTRDPRFPAQQFGYEQRRMDMELKVQEMQLEKELLWMQQHPGEIMPSNAQGGISGFGVDFHSTAKPPTDNRKSLGLDAVGHSLGGDVPVAPRVPPSDDVRLKADGTPDRRYKKQ